MDKYERTQLALGRAAFDTGQRFNPFAPAMWRVGYKKARADAQAFRIVPRFDEPRIASDKAAARPLGAPDRRMARPSTMCLTDCRFETWVNSIAEESADQIGVVTGLGRQKE